MLDLSEHLSSYAATDAFFGSPWIDQDEQREVPEPHRYLHGGFEGTGTRFSLYFPPVEHYRGRFVQPLEGGLGGSEHSYAPVTGVIGNLIGGYDFALGLGAYMVESNQGHVGAETCPKAGDDASVYGYRASAEVARLGRHLAGLLYGEEPAHGYVFGGSGGAGRSAMCLENVHDVWDGALTFMGVTLAPVDPAKGIAPRVPFAELYNAQRVLGNALWDVVDALEPGGSGEPLATLTAHQRSVLQDLYRAGFPRGAEFMVSRPMGAISFWGWSAEQKHAEDPAYYDRDFWHEVGYLGHDEPDRLVEHLVVDRTATVSRVWTAAEMGDSRASLLGNPGLRLAVALDGVDSSTGYLQGASLRIASGRAAGRQLWITGVMQDGGMLLVDGIGEAGNLRLADVEPGDEVVLDNRMYLAYCYRHRHLVDVADPAQAHLTLDGAPLYPQRTLAPAPMPPMMGVPRFEGRFQGKVLTVQHTHDSSIWPRDHRFEGAEDRWVLRWLEHAEHVPARALPPSQGPSPLTRMVDWKGAIEQSLHDLVGWVERGEVPTGTRGTVLEPGGALRLPEKAAERGGIQPVVRATADGGERADTTAGQAVLLEVHAEVPPGAGTVVRIAWDLDGTGVFAHVDESVDGSRSELTTTLTHVFSEPGTWFPSVKVTSHREGDVGARTRLVENLARVRVVVT
ncbi:MAG: hypothetical protein JWM31_1007 [Solirubrobacterales bacterium]|nr:hypothetical protein [Solirubrobacterales bacterium]